MAYWSSFGMGPNTTATIDDQRFRTFHGHLVRDVRPLWKRIWQTITKRDNSAMLLWMLAVAIAIYPAVLVYADLLFFTGLGFWWLLYKADRTLMYKMPVCSPYYDKHSKGGKGEGILYIGNELRYKHELWFSNSEARTHFLYLGTTGSGKTEGLKSIAINALCWGSGFIYVDGKADTNLWSSVSAMVRRFGRDDDLMVLNYMTGNSDTRAPSNSMNPFSTGSASFLTNMLVSLMPESQGDNAMWKERAVALVAAIMPGLTWRRDNLDIPLSISVLRDYLALNKIISLARDKAIPQRIRDGLQGYLDTLPGYNDAAFGDDGNEKPPGPNQPMIDTTTARQQHGYLAMQFTRSLQSLGQDYGYIFDTSCADVDMVDIVLNRRILIVLIPALEKSSDETANLGKIVAATLKGMMGSTLGATVEGESATVIENKPTHSSTPFMTIFDEVGYYTAPGMAVMAAQARSLGFCLVFAAQDLPALEKRVKEEARSITANCNIKIFGKLEDPTQTKDFFDKTVGTVFVTEVSGFTTRLEDIGRSYRDSAQASIQPRPRASYDALHMFKEGEAVVAFGKFVLDVRIFYANPGDAKAMRVQRFMPLPPPNETLLKHAKDIRALRDRIVRKGWSAQSADEPTLPTKDLEVMDTTFVNAGTKGLDPVQSSIMALASLYVLHNPDALKTKSARAPAQAAQPAPAATASASETAAAVGGETASASNPLSFFAKPENAAAPLAPDKPAAETVASTKPDLPPAISKGIDDILKDGVNALRDILFTSGKRENPSGA